MQNFDTLIISTPRLTLRPLVQADAHALLSIFSDADVVRHLSHREWPDLAHAHREIATIIEENRSGVALKLGVVLRETGELAGSVKLYNFLPSCRRCEIGYVLGAPYWGQGYIGEAVQAVIDHAFINLDLNRIEADIDPANTASSKILTRLGFEHEGLLRERWCVEGEVSDTAFYGLLRRDWAKRR